jgi:hypothetical protein
MEIREEDFNQLKQSQVDGAAQMDSMKSALKTQPAPVAPVAPVAPKVLPQTPTNPADKKDPDDSLTDDQAAQKLADLIEGMQKKIEDLSSLQGTVKQVVIDKEVSKLQAEIAAARKDLPYSDERDILLLVEQDPNKPVSEYAKLSHERNLAKNKVLEAQIEARVKEQLLKEKSGGLSVPQSPGSAPTPNPTVKALPGTEDNDWGKALADSHAAWGKS